MARDPMDLEAQVARKVAGMKPAPTAKMRNAVRTIEPMREGPHHEQGESPAKKSLERRLLGPRGS